MQLRQARILDLQGRLGFRRSFRSGQVQPSRAAPSDRTASGAGEQEDQDKRRPAGALAGSRLAGSTGFVCRFELGVDGFGVECVVGISHAGP